MQLEKLILTVEADKKQLVVDMLKKLDYVNVQSREEQLEEFMRMAPRHIPLTEADIDKEFSRMREEKRK